MSEQPGDTGTEGSGEWMIEGTAHICGLGQLPDRVLDMNDTERYAVFSKGETLLLVPDEEVQPDAE